MAAIGHIYQSRRNIPRPTRQSTIMPPDAIMILYLGWILEMIFMPLLSHNHDNRGRIIESRSSGGVNDP